MSAPSNKKFTGRRRTRTTRKGVKWVDRGARLLITAGGIGAVLAILLVGVFLLSVVWPLFRPARFTAQRDAITATVSAGTRLLGFGVDEFRTLCWTLTSDGTMRVQELQLGKSLSEAKPFEEEASISATALPWDRAEGAVGFDDGTIRLVSANFATKLLEAELLPDEVRDAAALEPIPHESGVLSRTPQGQYRHQSFQWKVGAKLELTAEETEETEETSGAADKGANPLALRAMDLVKGTGGHFLCTATANGKIQLHSLIERLDPLLGETVLAIEESFPLKYPPDASAAPPHWLMMTERADAVFAIWKSGRLVRFDVRDLSAIRVVEELRVIEQGELTSVQFLLGRGTILCGDSQGGLRGWFVVRPEGRAARGIDGAELIAAHDLAGGKSAVTSLAPSLRSRLLAVGYADGSLRVFHVTTDRLVIAAQSAAGESTHALDQVVLAPKEDAIFSLSQGALTQYSFEPGHPEISFRSLFRPIWYEGHEKPSHTWQSSASTADVEPKFGLYPLMFGTIKATLYSMLFGAPLALLAAIYTSEFMDRKLRGRIKPIIEMMASLPSVVLGFLAGLTIAPFVDRHLATVLAFSALIPLMLILTAYLWQCLPSTVSTPLAKYRPPIAAVMLGLCLLLSFPMGATLEQSLFSGDIKHWLTDVSFGTATGGWFVLLLPLCSLLAVAFRSRLLGPWLETRRTVRVGPTLESAPAARPSRGRLAARALVSFLLTVAAVVLLGYGMATLFGVAGFDPRRSFAANYEARNALVVGFVMGFAIIPLMYTIAEDALSAVPESLRAASLGAGATPWQTAVRIVIPTAMSGLFSALMIGLGRAVGETMIVLMATGSTPVMEWNPFNGFRTLSANIAIELPEAAQNGTHYRTLFFAALTLFVMTFAVNTIAEMVRLRFRRRMYQL